ncbi:hypothetical protein AXG93_3546s1200 [Marchantia polymorpha subsp. ruderalis]|uniref:SLC26A/SulP transporter domain-containing protein n=1 Tax=Marchantia polymorpha subsp. ruderalis TaxID=1480154 RepID=A0A176WSV6_MARPO|nr:hypothetical protein AXG93_3546s1200 [Marchantia polymorpha subsp. ruderalis]
MRDRDVDSQIHNERWENVVVLHQDPTGEPEKGSVRCAGQGPGPDSPHRSELEDCASVELTAMHEPRPGSLSASPREEAPRSAAAGAALRTLSTTNAKMTSSVEEFDDDDISEWELFWLRVRANLQFKTVNFWEEVSGSMGDLGTFIPLLLTLAFVNGVDVGTTLLFTGLYNVVTGIVFGVPMPVQPMKYIFSVAITDGDPLTVPQIMAAGLSTAFVLMFCGMTGLMNVATRLVPTPVIRGFQLSQGISFGVTAIKYIVKKQDFMTGKDLGPRDWLGTDGMLLALCAFTFVVLVSGPGDDMVQQASEPEESDARYSKLPTSSMSLASGIGSRVMGIGEEGSVHRGTLAEGLLRAAVEESMLLHGYKPGELKDVDLEGARGDLATEAGMSKMVIPSALLVFLFGVGLAVARDWGSVGTAGRVKFIFGPALPQVVKITWDDWKVGFLRAAVPQIPLSLISTVVAVTKLSNNLFPEKKNVTALSVSTAVGIFNSIGCCFGTLPVECGAGGLAAQFRFGARSGFAVIFLGAVKLVLSLFLGSSLLRMLAEFPICLLGVILLLAGMELAIFCRDQNTRLDAFVMVVCATVTLFGFSAPMGFTCGFATYLLLKLRQKIRKYILTKSMFELMRR